MVQQVAYVGSYQDPLKVYYPYDQEINWIDYDRCKIIKKQEIKKIESNKFKINNGDEVQDIITNYKGIVIQQATWLFGCNTMYVISKVKKDDVNNSSGEWFDENSLKIQDV